MTDLNNRKPITLKLGYACFISNNSIRQRDLSEYVRLDLWI